MQEREWYKEWFSSPFYHKLYFSRDEAEAKAFIQCLSAYLKPLPDSRMLDVACGKGRHSRLLAADGYWVTGIDISASNIEYAKQFENGRLQFYVHDMRLPFWINYFDYAFNFFTSFGYFKTRREHDNAVHTITGSIKRGGTVVFDYLNVHYAEQHLVPNELKIIGETAYDIHRWQDDDFFYKKITVTDPDLKEPQTFTEKVAKFSLGDFTDMLSFQKMQVADVFGDYQLQPYDIQKKPRMIVIAEKKG